MISHFSKTRTVVYWSVLLYAVGFLPFCRWLLESQGGGCGNGSGFALLFLCFYSTLFISAVGLIDTIVLIFRGVWDRISPSFFFRAFQLNIGLFALMCFFMLVCLL